MEAEGQQPSRGAKSAAGLRRQRGATIRWNVRYGGAWSWRRRRGRKEKVASAEASARETESCRAREVSRHRMMMCWLGQRIEERRHRLVSCRRRARERKREAVWLSLEHRSPLYASRCCLACSFLHVGASEAVVSPLVEIRNQSFCHTQEWRVPRPCAGTDSSLCRVLTQRTHLALSTNTTSEASNSDAFVSWVAGGGGERSDETVESSTRARKNSLHFVVRVAANLLDFGAARCYSTYASCGASG